MEYHLKNCLADEMSEKEKDAVIDELVKLADITILNKGTEFKINTRFKRRLPNSTLFRHTPYKQNEYGSSYISVNNMNFLIREQLIKINEAIRIQATPDTSLLGTKIIKPKKIFIEPNSDGLRDFNVVISKRYINERLLYYNDNSFSKKLMLNHRELLNIISKKIIDKKMRYVTVCPSFIGEQSSEGFKDGIYFSAFGMSKLGNSYQINQMALTIINVLFGMGIKCSEPLYTHYLDFECHFECYFDPPEEKPLKPW